MRPASQATEAVSRTARRVLMWTCLVAVIAIVAYISNTALVTALSTAVAVGDGDDIRATPVTLRDEAPSSAGCDLTGGRQLDPALNAWMIVGSLDDSCPYTAR